MIVPFATLANVDDWVEMEYFANYHQDYLRKYIELKNGIPSLDTLCRVFGMISPDILQQLYRKWQGLLNRKEGERLKKIFMRLSRQLRKNIDTWGMYVLKYNYKNNFLFSSNKNKQMEEKEENAMMMKKHEKGIAAFCLLSAFFIFVLLFTFRGFPVKAEEMSADAKAAVRDYLYEKLMNRDRQIDIEQYNVPLENLDDIISDMRSIYSKQLYYIQPRYSYACENGRVSRVLFRENACQKDDMDADMQSALRDALSHIKDGMSDAQKAIVLHDWLALHCEYDMEVFDEFGKIDKSKIPPADYTARGALINRIAVCEGYSAAYQYLLKQAGIKSYRVSSPAMEHTWTLVELDGKYYHVDVTNDDLNAPLLPHSISHDRMLRSDSGIMAEGYHGWTIYDTESVTTYVVTLECDDTRYDNLSWDRPSDYVWDGDTCYYAYSIWGKGGIVGKVTLKGDGPEEEILKTWEVPKSEYYAVSCDIFRSGDRLYYNTTHEIRSMAMDGTDDRLEYGPVDTDNIYRISLQDGKLCYKLPGAESWEKTGIALEEEPEPLPDIFSFIKEIRFDYDKMVLQTGETFEVGVKPAYIRDLLKWSSDNPSVVTINENGKLTAVSEGEAVITASDTEGNVLGSFKVSVLPGMQEGDIAGGNAWNLVWSIDADGTLSVEGDGGGDDYADSTATPWGKYRDIKAAKLEVENLKGMNNIFSKYPSLQSVDLTGTDMSDVTDMQRMFFRCNALKEVKFGDALASATVTNMEGMFRECDGLREIDLSALDLSHVTNMSFMLAYCSKLTKVNFGTSAMNQVADMSYMFAGCTSLEEIELGISADGKAADTDTNMRYMFKDCSALKRAVLGGFCATDMGAMFDKCESLETVDISGLDLSKVDLWTCLDFQSFDSLTSIAVPANMGRDINLKGKWKDENGAETSVAAGGLAVPMTYTKVINSSIEEPGTTVSLSLDKTKVTLYTGKASKSLTVEATVTGGTSKTVTWKTNKPKVATVKNGKITAVGKGTAIITATANGISKKVTVTVKNPTLTIKNGSKKFTKSGLTVKKKKKAVLTVTVSPKNSGISIAKLTAEQKKIASVTLKSGKITITGKNKGSFVLQIKSGKTTKKIKITVK